MIRAEKELDSRTGGRSQTAYFFIAGKPASNPPLKEKIAQRCKPMICRVKHPTIHNLSTVDTQTSHPFPQFHTQYLVVDIGEIGYILCLLVVKTGYYSSSQQPARKAGNIIGQRMKNGFEGNGIHTAKPL
ncbi:MAG: hypothetical protein KZQ90_06915 [Candidatus Thiodiazotropha sp. (ex Codakia rugifera)]|nr:hypothetical protein [Candidatus Thiodiazotropha sp. (ex Codakia rugifera)]